MKKRAFIIHGWGGYPEEAWFPWLKQELESRGFEVQVPAMPDSDTPVIETWVSFLSKLIGDLDEKTYLIGHSIGCQAILRYLERLPENVRVAKAVFVAGWFTLQGLETKDEERIAEPWLEQPINLEKVRAHIQENTAIFSDDDPFVPLIDKDIFSEKLQSKIVIEHAKGHLSTEHGITVLPSVLQAVIE